MYCFAFSHRPHGLVLVAVNKLLKVLLLKQLQTVKQLLCCTQRLALPAEVLRLVFLLWGETRAANTSAAEKQAL